MTLSCFRFFRLLRSIVAPATAVIGLSFLLIVVFILYQPTPGPGIVQRLGWQSWDAVTTADYFENSGIQHPEDVEDPDDTASQDQPTNTPPSDTDWLNVDWWNTTDSGDDPVDISSYPTDVWAPLLPHDTGLSEITITRCMIPIGFSGGLCDPGTTIEQDAVKGKWVRVDRDLNKQSGVWSLNIYYRRTRRLDIPLVTDLKLLPAGELPTPLTDPWVKVERSIRDGVMRKEPLFLWYKTGKTSQEMSAEEKQNMITEIDVLFGEDKPWYGFDKLQPAVTPEKEGHLESVYVTYRRGVKHVPRAPPLHFSKDGKFKILQVADLHYSVSRGVCRETVLDPCYASDNLTNSLLGHALDAEKPDLVVFTGDQLNGQGTSWDPKSVLAKFAVEITDRKIPWAAVFGNHDEENGDNGPKDIHGVGNYVLKVKSADRSMTHLLTLYFMDSGAYSKGYLDWFGYFFPTEYDWIHEDQINWFLQQSGSIDPIERPFTPDTANDLADLSKRQSDQIAPATRKLAKPNALMFFHIPLQESYADPDTDIRTGLPLDIGGLLKALESEHRGAGAIPEVKVVANGHCHITEDCKRVQDVWLCFGGGGSYSGYGKVGFDRRFRVYDISDYGETIRTYKRTEHDDILNELIIAGSGAAPYNLQS
ncbi:Metallo-dependent phosphatase-like protein [Melanogaster broomeanus]|nr:Metallo-dependent phosphatase-like protein [Melanogaster broomeanus]